MNASVFCTKECGHACNGLLLLSSSTFVISVQFESKSSYIETATERDRETSAGHFHEFSNLFPV
jgi:hypothetical protein